MSSEIVSAPIKAVKVAEDCNVCCGSKKSFVTCLYCSEKACVSCYETYCLDQINDKCMFCNKTWNLEFVQNNYRTSFLNGDYKEHKKKMILEREKALLPQTQLEIEADKKKREYTLEIERLILKERFIKKELSQLKKDHSYGVMKTNDYRISKEQKEFERDETLRKIYRVRQALLGREINDDDDDYEVKSIERIEKVERKVPTIPCSVNDCRGFLSSSDEEKDYKCGICSVVHCKRCRCVKKDDEHKCDKDTLETIKMLKNDTKPCPKCNVPIFKTEGCDQMWCVQCHTAFSWRTGKIENGHVHNPHYWQYLQTQGRDLDAVRRMQNPNGFRQRQGERCGEMRDLLTAVPSNKIGVICQRLQHIRFDQIPRHTNEENYQDRNRDLRKKYLLNDINEVNFKKTLMMREKRANFNTEITQVLTMLYDASNDMLISVYRDNYRHRKEFYKEITNTLNEINDLTTYALEQCAKISDRFGYKFDRMVKKSLVDLLEASDKDKKLNIQDRSGVLW